ncbi:hypothetical protein SPRG_20038 [Saprolegnia parasitica CBS 223.65]|uniref:Aspartyl/glutamyl-tRNA(Asn/Gln) amidotransferase subunit C n=1 Tax=Saprolegnia parasitica (strain CBS 223.65) TaxID=695850 RepID=A0A067CQN3_SAPPC|nr:hypothetical protein SPRG_20038 [Saprolegnia parasitica CBS 223.65]KDO28836.1 hypothetical protein SPRG_20038 [Saprolegnia parasitica CBS 223.65]|eukprot:XP_012200566.1 hypothetical protein SPRG_20038 [Saprolegnia parasitica CBS 223.65]
MSTTTTLVDITQAPRTASWSIHELQRHDADVLTSASLLNLAELCHLHIPDDKLPTLLKEVEDIIQCTKTIQEITLDDNIDDFYARSEALSTQSAPLRPDEALEGNCPDDVLANASVKHGYYFQVPKVLED